VIKNTWQRPVLLEAVRDTELRGSLRTAIRWALVVIADQQAEIERLKDLLREAVECMDDTPDGWAEDWVKRAAQAAGWDDG